MTAIPELLIKHQEQQKSIWKSFIIYTEISVFSLESFQPEYEKKTLLQTLNKFPLSLFLYVLTWIVNKNATLFEVYRRTSRENAGIQQGLQRPMVYLHRPPCWIEDEGFASLQIFRFGICTVETKDWNAF